MANSFEVDFKITDPNVATGFTGEADNPFGDRTVYVWFFHAEGTPSFSTLENTSNLFGPGSIAISANGSATFTPGIQNLDPNTRYSYMWSMTDNSTFDSADVFRRRPLNPPDSYVSASNPIFTDLTLANATRGEFYSDAVDADLVTSFTLISGMPSGLSLNTNNGAITGTPNFTGSSNIIVEANNQYGSTRGTASITVDPGTPTWIDENLAGTAFIDALYDDEVEASEGAEYRISAGSLPAGIALNTATGAVSGTPTTEGTSSFTIQAFNVTGTISAGFDIEVISGLQPPSFTDSTLSTDLRVGIDYSDSVSATDADAYNFVGSSVPGLAIDNSGNVTGTPTAQGTFDFDIVASNAAGSATANFSLPVKPGAERYDGTAFQRVGTFKRYDGTAFVDVEFVKRYDGTAWVDANL